jgi:hypothetical protein
MFPFQKDVAMYHIRTDKLKQMQTERSTWWKVFVIDSDQM